MSRKTLTSQMKSFETDMLRLKNQINVIQQAANVKLSGITLALGQPTEENGLGGLDGGGVAVPTNMTDPTDSADLTNKGWVENLVSTIPVYDPQVAINGASLAVSQEPVALDTPQIIEFGAAQSALGVDLAVNGVVTFNTVGVFSILVSFNAGRGGNPGNANVVVQTFLDSNDGNGLVGVPNGTFIERIGNNDTFQTQGFTFNDFVVSNPPNILQFELARSSLPAAAANDGGLFQVDVTGVLPTFTIQPSATILIQRII